MNEYRPNKDITELNSDDIPPGTTTIRIYDNTSLKTLSDLPDGLQKLYLSGCTSLTTLSNLPDGLQVLYLSGCTSLETLSNLPDGLQVLYLTGCTSLTTLSDLPDGLQELALSGCTSLTTLSNLPDGLQELSLSDKTSLKILSDLPDGLQELNLNDCNSLKTLSDLPPNLEELNLTGYNSLETLSNLPAGLQKLYLFGCTSLETLSDLPDGLQELYLTGCNKLTTLPDLPAGLQELNLSDYNSLETLSDLPPNLEELNLSDCTSLTTLSNLPANLQKLNLSGCTSLTTLPDLPPNLQELNLSGCTLLTTLPDLPPNLQELDLTDCTSLPNNPALIAQLEELEEAMQERSYNSILTWPDHLDRSEKITKIKEDISSAYEQFYHDDTSFNDKSPNISDHANYPVLSLMHRFMSESLVYRGGLDKVVESILPTTEQISKNPSILEYINPIAQYYLAGCVNQPVAGFVIIANIVEIDKQTSLQEKIDQSKFLFLVHKINEECVKLAKKLQVGQEVEVEFANAMLKQVNDKLIANGDISKPIPGTPDGISYVDTVKRFLSEENIETIYKEVESALSELTREKIVENITNSEYQMFWTSQSLGDDVMAQYKQDIKSLQEKYLSLQEKYLEPQGEGPMTGEEFEEQSLQIKSKIIEESKNKTLSFLEGEEERRKKRMRHDEIDYKSKDKGDDVSHEEYTQECYSNDEGMLTSVTEMPVGSSLSGQKRGRDPR
jgi:hypothetical protein